MKPRCSIHRTVLTTPARTASSSRRICPGAGSSSRGSPPRRPVACFDHALHAARYRAQRAVRFIRGVHRALVAGHAALQAKRESRACLRDVVGKLRDELVPCSPLRRSPGAGCPRTSRSPCARSSRGLRRGSRIGEAPLRSSGHRRSPPSFWPRRSRARRAETGMRTEGGGDGGFIGYGVRRFARRLNPIIRGAVVSEPFFCIHGRGLRQHSGLSPRENVSGLTGARSPAPSESAVFQRSAAIDTLAGLPSSAAV